MKIPFYLIVFLFLSIKSYADWDDALKNANSGKTSSTGKTSSKSSVGKPSHTAGLDINTDEKIEYTTEDDWFNALKSEIKKPKVKIPKEYAEILGKVAQMDAMLPDNLPEKAMIFSQFAVAYLYAGDYVEAEKIGLRSVRKAEILTGKNSFETLTCISTLGLIYFQIGDYDRALMMAESSLKICDANPKMANEFRPSIIALKAISQLQLGFTAEALTSSSEALTLARKLGTKGKSGATPLLRSLQARAAYFSAIADYNQANELLQEALKIAKAFNLRAGQLDFVVNSIYQELLLSIFENHVAQGNEADARIALELYEKQMAYEFKDLDKGFRDINTLQSADSFASKAILYHLRNDSDAAKNYASKYINFHKSHRESALLLVESQRLNWQKRHLSFSIPVAFCSTEELADLVLQWKGIVIDSISRDRHRLRASGNSENKKALAQLAALRRMLARTLMQRHGDEAEQTSLLKNKIFSLEQEISKKSVESGLVDSLPSPTLVELKKCLPGDTALVEFISYRELPDFRHGLQRMGAIVITRDAPPRWFPLGPAADIEALTRSVRSQIQSPTEDDQALGAILTESGRLLFHGIQESLPSSISKIVISPDGELNFMPFACLLQPDGSFLGEKFAISYVGSGRDLLKKTTPPSSKQMQVFANPAFDASVGLATASSNASTLRSLSIEKFSEILLPPLPGADLEAARISATAQENGWTSQVLSGADATEARLASIQSPAILHLATHGFFLGREASVQTADQNLRGMVVKGLVSPGNSPIDQTKDFNPMLQSGIAMAGAQSTLAAWGGGKAPAPENDGILTAEEVAALDLGASWLVALSACDTGVGEARSGEGVFGLRRAFMMAGSQNLLMTLWPVLDQSTADFMADFYTRCLSSLDAPAAFAETQRLRLTKIRQEHSLRSAVRQAGPFVLATTGLIQNPN